MKTCEIFAAGLRGNWPGLLHEVNTPKTFPYQKNFCHLPSKTKQYHFVLEEARCSGWNDNPGARTTVLFLPWFVTSFVYDLGQGSGLAVMLSTWEYCRQQGLAVSRVWIPRNLPPSSSQDSCVGWPGGSMKHVRAPGTTPAELWKYRN